MFFSIASVVLFLINGIVSSLMGFSVLVWTVTGPIQGAEDLLVLAIAIFQLCSGPGFVAIAFAIEKLHGRKYGWPRVIADSY